jgi:hypothetical protein
MVLAYSLVVLSSVQSSGNRLQSKIMRFNLQECLCTLLVNGASSAGNPSVNIEFTKSFRLDSLVTGLLSS